MMENDVLNILEQLRKKLLLVGLDKILNFFTKFKKEKEKGIIFIGEDEHKVLRILENVLLQPTVSIEKLEKRDEKLKKIIEHCKEFFNEWSIVEVDGRYAIIPQSPEKLFSQRLREGKTKEIESIEVLPLHDEAFDKFKEIKRKAEKEVAEIINSLPIEFRNIIHLAYQVRQFYEEGKIELAEGIKREIRKRGEKYLKLCNCFCEGYIEKLIYEYKDKELEFIVAKINELLSKPIFFIHSYMGVMDVQETIYQIEQAFKKGEEYIAIHSLGYARRIAEIIKKTISQPEGYESWSFKNEKEFTCVWYKKGGRKILKLLPIYGG